MKYNLSIGVYTSFLVVWALSPSAVMAQIIPDQTLPVNSRTIPRGNTIQIEGGTSLGDNLFHSFSEFSVSKGQIAEFNNNPGVQNVISRITGRTISNIDGILKANGKANFFLLNSNGIVFGPNAGLDIGGSFLASTASSIKFEDGNELISTDSGNKPLLSVSAPIGLHFGRQTGNIVVQGTGHLLRNTVLSPVSGFDDSRDGLEVQPGETLGLIGGEVTLDGAVLTANSGNIEIGSINIGTVELQESNAGYLFKYSNQSSFENIELTNRTLINASGLGDASIQFQGKDISFDEASVSIIQNSGPIPGGKLSLTATNKLTISGTNQTSRIAGGVYSESLGLGAGGNIQVITPTLVVQKGGAISTRTFGEANAGNISLDIPNSVEVLGVSPRESRLSSSITSISGLSSSNNSGDISLSTQDLTVADGALLGTLSFSSGDGGAVGISASDSILVSGVDSTLFTPALISSTAFRGGDAGSVTINTSRLFVRQGGRVDSSTTSSGAAGKVTINASDFIEVSGSVPGSRNPSLITSSANILDDPLLEAFSIFRPTGKSGDVDIQTGQLLVKDGGLVSVQNDGPNDAGQLKIAAKDITISNGGMISGITNGGNGGDVFLVSDFLLLEDGSISASATKQGQGGNISSITDFVVALGNSSITAEAEDAQGGNIFIAANAAIFGPNTDVSASSDAGLQLDGNINIDVERTGIEQATTPTPEVTPTPKIISACNPGTGPSKFVVLGPGALKLQPSSIGPSSLGWNRKAPTEKSTPPPVNTPKSPQIVEAVGWQKIEGDKIVLTAPSNGQNNLTASNPACDTPSS